MTELHILRVFSDEYGDYGDPVGIIIDEKRHLDVASRQKIAHSLEYSEVVFINDLEAGDVSIYAPFEEIPFAGRPLVGASWFISDQLGHELEALQTSGGIIPTWQDYNELTWISAKLDITPPWQHEYFEDASEIDELELPQDLLRGHTQVWGWLGEGKQRLRARTFATDWGILEAESNGSGAMQLAALAGKELEIFHGQGSIIYAKPAQPGFASVGGRVIKSATRYIEV